jgi:hypothetical protein
MRYRPLPLLATGLLTAGLAVGLAQFAFADDPRGEVAVTCTNPVSGTSWQIRVDYDKRTVDANPARVSDSAIWWRDAKDGANYTLDRKSGNLTAVFASSTGGSFLYHRCKL